ncbi:MAG: DUF992 domain-containing protein [Proteobacteria bacterium]|nr:DUF992 domain-containing protein [Pseudomonadota bacterium]
MLGRTLANTAVALGLLAAGPVPALAQGGATIAAGTLTCHLTDSSNVILFSEDTFDCTYRSAGGEQTAYLGEISKLGVNLSFKDAQILKWAVLAPATFGGPGILEGGYVGASVEVSVGVGVGGRVLVGGSRHQITLQPLSVSAQSGFGASVTLDSLKLTYLPS